MQGTAVGGGVEGFLAFCSDSWSSDHWFSALLIQVGRKLTVAVFPWVCRDLRLSLLGWGETTVSGVRGRGGLYCDSVALHLGFFGAQDQVHGHHIVIPPAC